MIWSEPERPRCADASSFCLRTGVQSNAAPRVKISVKLQSSPPPKCHSVESSAPRSECVQPAASEGSQSPKCHVRVASPVQLLWNAESGLLEPVYESTRFHTGRVSSAETMEFV